MCHSMGKRKDHLRPIKIWKMMIISIWKFHRLYSLNRLKCNAASFHLNWTNIGLYHFWPSHTVIKIFTRLRMYLASIERCLVHLSDDRGSLLSARCRVTELIKNRTTRIIARSRRPCCQFRSARVPINRLLISSRFLNYRYCATELFLLL